MNRHGSRDGHVTWTIRTNFSFLSQRRLFMFFFIIGPVALEDMFEIVIL